MKVLVPAPSQTDALGGVMEHVGGWFTVSVALQELVQPFWSVIVTVYVPAVPTVIARVVAVKPPGPDQK